MLLFLGVTGCADGPQTGAKGYVDGAGITELKPPERKPVGPVRGVTLEGNRLTLDQFKGHLVVLNVWASWCGPCRKEADALASAARKTRPNGVVFVGINTRESSPAQGLAFQKRHESPYPSFYDPAGRLLLSFHGTLPPSAVPATVVIDRQGRVAASILGPVPTERTLLEVLDDVNS